MPKSTQSQAKPYPTFILIMYWVYEVTQYRHGDQQGLLSDSITALPILLIQH